MGVMIEREEGDLRVLRITGLLRKSQWDAVLATEARQWGPTTHVKVLVMMEDFKDWERGVDWGDITFFDTYGDQVDKIAIVADANGRSRSWHLQEQGSGVLQSNSSL